jgi:hypothetical protein
MRATLVTVTPVGPLMSSCLLMRTLPRLAQLSYGNQVRGLNSLTFSNSIYAVDLPTSVELC